MASQASSEIGVKLRELREDRGYSLAQVARGTGISKSFVALVETGKSDITITRLMGLTGFYGVRIADVLPAGARSSQIVVRRGKGQSLRSPKEQIDVALLSRRVDRNMSPVLETFAVDGQTETSSHEGEEFLFVVSGRFELCVGDDGPVVIEQGDSAHFIGSHPHSCRNVGDSEGQILSLVTPAIF